MHSVNRVKLGMVSGMSSRSPTVGIFALVIGIQGYALMKWTTSGKYK